MTYKGSSYSNYSDEYSGSITIPATVTYNGVAYSVTSIGGSAFRDCRSLTTITLPEGVTSIGDYAFYSCSILNAITIPESVTSIGWDAFQLCNSLTAITIPEGMTSIGNFAFRYCGLTAITIPENSQLMSIGESAFNGCSSLTAITIPEGVTSIGNHAFFGCSSLTAITCHAVTPPTIGRLYTFNGVDKSIPVYVSAGSVEAYNVAEGWSEFTNIQPLSSDIASGTCGDNLTWKLTEGYELVIEGTGDMYDYSPETTPWYEYRESIQTITLPEGVTSIGSRAFDGCSSLIAIIVTEGNTVYDSRGGCNAIIETNSNTLIAGCSTTIIPEGVTNIGRAAFAHCSNLTAITLPEGVTSIGYGAFEGCNYLTDITLPKGLTSIEEYAFFNCLSLTAINIPKGVTRIRESAFDGCRSLTAITIPEGVTSIGGCAFQYCSSLTAITLPEGVTSIGGGAFANCSNLTAITIPEGVTSIDEYAFFNCRSLTAITCHAVTPPRIEGSTTFSGVDKTIPVYVPAGSVEAYKAAEGWSEFTNIQPLSKVLTVSSAGYATLYLDYAAKIPDNVKAYIGTRVEGNRLMMTQVTGVLPAETGVIVRAEAGTYTFEESKDMPANVEGNLLSGTATDTYITAESGYKYYVLARKEGLVAMYRPILTDGRFLNNANKAYIALDTNRLGIYDDDVNTDEEGGQLSNSLRFDFGGTTIIENPLLTIDKPQIIYDLHGRRVTDTEGLQGIYIIDGRKVVIK